MYIVFTNDLPKSIHEHPPSNNTFYNIDCEHIYCFADDSTLTLSHHDPVVLENNIAEKYQSVSDFIANNRLKLNSDKMHLLIMTSKIQHKKYQGFRITLDTGQEFITPVQNEKLLGAQISNDS